MASTNFLQWNPASNNQETDAEYTSDELRADGASAGQFLPSVTFNKFAYQSSTFVKAFADMLVARGYSPEDTSVATLQAILANIIFDGDITVRTPMQTINYALGALTLDASTYDGFQITLGGTLSSFTVSGATTGQVITMAFIEDVIGTYPVTFSSQFINPGTVKTTANAVSIQRFVALSNGYLYAVGPMVTV